MFLVDVETSGAEDLTESVELEVHVVLRRRCSL